MQLSNGPYGWDELCSMYADAERRMLGRNWRIEGWRKGMLMNGRYRVPTNGVNVMGNQMYTTIKLAVSLGSRNQVYLSAPYRDESPMEKETAAQKENFGYSLLDSADHYSFLRGHDLFRHEHFQQIIVDGWGAVQSLLDNNGEGGDPFKTKLLDVMDVAPIYSDERLECVFVKYYTTVGDAERRYRPSQPLGNDKKALVFLCDAWYYDPYNNDVWNTVWLMTGSEPMSYTPAEPGVKYTRAYPYFNKYSNECVLRHEREPSLKRLPIVLMPVGGAHWRTQTWNAAVTSTGIGISTSGGETRGQTMGTGMTNEEEWGHPLLYGIDHLMTYYNDLLSSLTELVDLYIHPTVVVKTRDGHVKEVKLGEDNYLAQNEAIEILWIQGNQPPFQEVLGLLAKHIDEGSLPSALRGGPADVNSGFLMDYMGGMAHNHLVRAVNAKNMMLREVIALQMEQYERASKSVVKRVQQLWGTDPAGSSRFNKLDPKRIAGYPWLKVETILATPQNEIQRANYVQILKQANIISEETARDMMRVQDPSREGSKITTEQVLRNPAIQQALAISDLIANDNLVAAMALAKSMNVPVQQPGGGLVGPDGKPMGGPNPRTGLPERPLPRPEAMPPAASQGQPNPAVATAAGQGAAGFKGTNTEAGRNRVERIYGGS